ncbi:dihydrolipoyl transacylase [Heterostelium album PN500]|uniref:Dihydrolipoamide acetyltransferase component of pyruvate dehydrogenase complex n=1 Tax=Heterostelium pallidum (strain ATCC 26659 / Pp 5 / PN500) TaxID=670386 RepID=D3BM03_HETP5|nr:dihydrolipoyl transacylase [Heterostelium album PN500]EFA77604.1 dihydrolipoyl transacylase [Heterostelium album PN500]|eukprot:XP_020429732.1 dihydrolipoyl transacylase [Heterostelium album PN500]
MSKQLQRLIRVSSVGSGSGSMIRSSLSLVSRSLSSSSTNNVMSYGNQQQQQQQQRISLNKLNGNNLQYSVRQYSSAAPIQFKLADIGEGIAECEIINWHFKVGDSIKEFDHLCDVQSDKATVEITSRYDGVISKLYYKVGDMAKVGSPLVDIIPEGGAAAPVASAPVAAAAPTPSASASTTTSSSSSSDHEHNIITVGGNPLKVLATPSVRHLAKLNSVKLSQVRGNGKDGRVLKEDLLNFLNGNQTAVVAAAPAAATTPAPTPAATASSQKDRETRIPITGIKKVMVKTMNAAALVPHFGYCDEYLMDGLMLLRQQLKPMAESRGIKLSYLPFLIKATSLALLKYPTLNSSMSPNETEIIVKNYHNIGVAMDTPQGLLVPNIKGVESKSIFEIAQELNRLQKVGLAGQLTPNDMSGGTFSLSNIGTIGGTYASPVLLLPEVAIGAIGKIQKLPRFDKNNNVYPVHLMQISWSADHRVIDGATMANFSNLLKSYIETPNTMLLDTK